MNSSFFRAEHGTAFCASISTSGPWDPGLQHAGPPAALLCHVIEELSGDDGRRVARVSFDILGPVPVGPVVAQARTVRAGRRIELLEAQLEDPDGRVLLVCRAWRFPHAELTLPAEVTPRPMPDRIAMHPGHYKVPPFFPIAHDVGYHTSMQWRFVDGSWRDSGPAVVWLRMSEPLIEGLTPSPLQRVVIAADSASGASAGLDPARHTFPNVDLTVHLLRDPVGEWIGFDATTLYSGTGTGWTHADIYDEDGLVGASSQTLLVARRGARL